MEDFSCRAARSFAFLVDEYGFQLTSAERQSSLDSITYEKKPVVIELGWDKGEIDIRFHIDLESDIFRPYISRTFRLSEIALRQDKNAYRNCPRFPNYITTPVEANLSLQFEARVMKKYGESILRGDIRILAEITKRRRAGA